LQKLARLAYSAERAAAFAYQGHARSVRDPVEKSELAQIEAEEWLHRENLARIMARIGILPSRFLEIKYAVIGKGIGFSCRFIGWFMPMYFAGRLESGNVIEYVHMEILALEYGLEDEVDCIREMARVEKTHEMYFLEKAKTRRVIGLFEFLFRWGPGRSFNDLPPEPFILRSRAEVAG
jgi:demethoxyubiquinone hydroxylase (CLK1/Coq7/Cat5 family)